MVRGAASTLVVLVASACLEVPPPPVVEGEGGRWEELAPLAGGPRQESCVVALRGEVVVVGGIDELGATLASVEAYSPVAGRWRRLADLPLSLHHANCAVVDGQLVVAGFLLGVDFTPDGRVLVYDPDADAWTQATSMPDGTQRGAAGTAAHGGWVYVLGGLQRTSQEQSSRYDLSGGQWQELAALPVALDHLAAVAVEDRLFVVGGRTDGLGLHTAQTLELDATTGAASPRASMPTSRAGFAAAVLGDELVVAGGEGNAAHGDGVFEEVELYHPASDTWRSAVPMRTPRHGMGAAVVDGALYVPGGADRQGFAAVAIHERFVPVEDPD